MGFLTKLTQHRLEALKVLAVWVFAVAIVWLAAPTRASFAAGIGIVLLGLLVRGWAAGHLQRNTGLATSGPYAYLRDPLYLGRLLLLCGFAIMANHPIAYALFGAALLVFFLNYMPRKLRKETRRLEKAYGEPYVEYRRQVRSLIPRLTPYPKRSPNRWSLAVYWHENREYWLLLAALALAALLALRTWAIL